MISKLLITDEYDGYEVRYPELLEHMNTQLDVNFWSATEADVEADALELKYTIPEQGRKAIKMMLPMFTRYEMIVSDFWTHTYQNMFKAPECKDVASAINMMERCVHARFYDKVNKVFGLDNDESYLSYTNDPVFKSRVKWIGELLCNEDDKLVCLAFGLIEAAALFSLFALLRSFQANGNNYIAATVKGTKQSAIDERLHSLVLSDSFRYYYAELGITINEDVDYLSKVLEAAQQLYLHEEHIIDSIIPENGLNGVSREEYKLFVKRRIDEYFERLGSKTLPFNVGYSSLDAWFDIQNEAYSEPDFFTKGAGKEYESGWDEDGLVKAWL
jgi:ribonucleotide reductase beta subunit family protein with ferritin-like domain